VFSQRSIKDCKAEHARKRRAALTSSVHEQDHRKASSRLVRACWVVNIHEVPVTASVLHTRLHARVGSVPRPQAPPRQRRSRCRCTDGERQQTHGTEQLSHGEKTEPRRPVNLRGTAWKRRHLPSGSFQRKRPGRHPANNNNQPNTDRSIDPLS